MVFVVVYLRIMYVITIYSNFGLIKINAMIISTKLYFACKNNIFCIVKYTIFKVVQ